MLLSIVSKIISSHQAFKGIFETLVNLSEMLSALFSLALLIAVVFLIRLQKRETRKFDIFIQPKFDNKNTLTMNVNNPGIILLIKDPSGENDPLRITISWPPGFKLLPFIDSESPQQYSVQLDQAH
jgi:hypothetical protein